jgi:hypothetical protein
MFVIAGQSTLRRSHLATAKVWGWDLQFTVYDVSTLMDAVNALRHLLAAEEDDDRRKQKISDTTDTQPAWEL